MQLLEEQIDAQRARGGILGTSSAILHVLETAQRLATSDTTTILLEGESGTGKELLARFICSRSQRADRSFITVSCGAIHKDLAENEFFGSEHEAFTGTTEKVRRGKFELADGGTILLDEVGELSLDMQVKLLRMLEDGRFYRLGGTRELTVDVRVIAATNRDLDKEVAAGSFREDLYYRLNVAIIKMPPLRNRKEDIPILARSFLQEFAGRFGKPIPALGVETLDFLEHLQWRGNVRELRNAMERVMLLNDVSILKPAHFGFLVDVTVGKQGAGQVGTGRFRLEVPSSGVKMNDVLCDLIMKTLDLTRGNQVQAAKILGISRSKLRYRMEQLSIHHEQQSFKVSVPEIPGTGHSIRR